MNQIEIWFSILTERQSRRGVFKNVKDLVAAIERYIVAHNQDPAPFIWTKTPEQLLAKAINRKDMEVTRY